MEITVPGSIQLNAKANHSMGVVGSPREKSEWETKRSGKILANTFLGFNE